MAAVCSATQPAHQANWTLVDLPLILVPLSHCLLPSPLWEALVKSGKWLKALHPFVGGRGRRAAAVQEIPVTPGSASNSRLTSSFSGGVKALSRLSAQGSVTLVHLNEH